MKLDTSNATFAVYVDDKGRIVAIENVKDIQSPITLLQMDDKGRIVAIENVKDIQSPITSPQMAEGAHRHDTSTVFIQTRSGDNFYSVCCQFGRCWQCLKIGPIDYLKEIGLLTKRLLGMYPKPPQI